MKVIIKNSDLVFQRKHIKQIVYKDYWVRSSGQGVNLGSLGGILDSMGFNELKGILNAYYTDVVATTEIIFMNRGGNNGLSIPVGKTLQYTAASGQNVFFTAFQAPQDFEVSFNGSTGVATLNNIETQTASGTPSTSLIQFCGIYMQASKTDVSTYTGKTKFSRLRLYKLDDTPICDVRPALVDGVPCLYDSVSDTEFYSVDGTNLVLEDA